MKIMKMQQISVISKLTLFALLAFYSTVLFSQEIENERTAFRVVTGVGPMNLSGSKSPGIAMNSSLELEIKRWLWVSANVHIGKSGNNKTDYTYFKYFPDSPESIETNFNETNVKGSTINGFSTAGVYGLLNPVLKGKTRFVFGPGLCFVSWEEMTTVFRKDFEDNEFYEITSRVTNRKKMDLGVRFTLEREISRKIFIGLNFQGYLGVEEASGLSVVAGFKLN